MIMAKQKFDMVVRKVDDHYTVSSESDPSTLYRVDVDERDIMGTTCNCVSYYMGRKRPCKHGCKVLEALEVAKMIEETKGGLNASEG